MEGRGVSVIGTLLYLIDESTSQLQIYDVSAPSAPSAVGTYNITGRNSVPSLFVDPVAKIAYVTTEDTFLLINVTDPARPTKLGTVAGNHCRVVFAAGGLAYVADRRSFRVVDVSHPSQPSTLCTLADPSIMDIYVAGTTAYLAATGGLFIVDVSVPSAPTRVGSYIMLSATLLTVDVMKNTAYVTTSDLGILTIDVSVPTAPRLLGSYIPTRHGYNILATTKGFVPGRGHEISISGTTAFVVDAFNEVMLLDVGAPSIFVLAQEVGKALSVAMSAAVTAFVGVHNGGNISVLEMVRKASGVPCWHHVVIPVMAMVAVAGIAVHRLSVRKDQREIFEYLAVEEP
eukprot:TRINITY_DN46879_c0_g1_i1.p1 TRINITY_DN46879_c0_g1~~TRINITY_DN46879_c0_g1_i1.p1  ORF type:complete len:382 (+),score=53.22 TRINITY_DN46879_c0_g1_i1:115-1146(+)